jgi:hypothetical protein
MTVDYTEHVNAYNKISTRDLYWEKPAVDRHTEHN